jgi:hypothetical protein
MPYLTTPHFTFLPSWAQEGLHRLLINRIG